MKNQMNNQKGFTLIELIIVIVILGILAVTAAPRFIDLQNDARESALQGIAGALQGSVQLVYAKAAIAGVQGVDSADTPSVNMRAAAGTVSTHFGYPDASTITTANIADFLDLSADFAVVAGDPAATNFAIRYATGGSATCQVLYTDAGAAGAAPLISVVATGCQ